MLVSDQRATESGLRVRLFRDEDREAVFSLYGQVFGEESLELFRRRWEWQFLRNPATRLAPSLIWLAESGGEIVGHLASFPQRMKFLDEQRVIYHDCDLLVSPTARRQGVGRRLVAAYDNCPNLLSNCLAYAPANGRIRARLGYQPAHALPRYLRPYDIGAIVGYMANSGRLSGLASKPPFSWLVRGLMTGLTGAARVVNAAKKPQPSGEFTVECATSIGREFDDLWNRLSPSFPLVAVRDRDFVQWRFVEDPVFDNTILVARDRKGILVGYLAMRVWARSGMTDGRVMDLFCPPGELAISDSLLHAALKLFEQHGVDLVSSWGLHPKIREGVRRHLYLAPSKLDHPSWLLWKGSEELRSVVYNADNWHISCADSDIGFNP